MPRQHPPRPEPEATVEQRRAVATALGVAIDDLTDACVACRRTPGFDGYTARIQDMITDLIAM